MPHAYPVPMPAQRRTAIAMKAEAKPHKIDSGPIVSSAHRVSAQSAEMGQAMIDLLRPHKERCKTITLDNGKEFADHQFIAKCLGAKVYFAHPYCPWERGLNENHNGLLRPYFPKDMGLAGVTQTQVDEAVYALNHRPRKCLGWLTPHEVFHGLGINSLRLETRALRT